MTEDNIVRIVDRPHKGPWKGPDHNKEAELKSVGAEFEKVVLGMKQMLDSDLAQKA